MEVKRDPLHTVYMYMGVKMLIVFERKLNINVFTALISSLILNIFDKHFRMSYKH